MDYIRQLPINDTPEIFGLHDNANITFAQNETFSLLNGILRLQPKSSSGAGRSREEVSFTCRFYALYILQGLKGSTPVKENYQAMISCTVLSVLYSLVDAFL